MQLCPKVVKHSVYIYIYIYTHTLHILWIQNFVTVTSGISHKNTKYTTERHCKYFIYNIQILHQVHYLHLTIRL
jgi:hypothetical protein